MKVKYNNSWVDVIRVNLVQSGFPKVKDCSYLFSEGARWAEKDSVYKVIQPINASYMFYKLPSSVNTISLQKIDFSNTTNMAHMLHDCGGLQIIDLSGIDLRKVTDMSYMFYNCKKLETLDISGFDLTKLSESTTGMGIFTNCGISTSSGLTTVYVKNKACQDWILSLSNSSRPSNWSVTNIMIKEG